MKSFLLMLWLGLIVLSGCSSLGPSQPFQSVTSEELWDRIWENQSQRQSQVRAIRSKIQLSLAEKKRSLSGTGILISKAEEVRLELRDPLGRLQYSVAQSENHPFVAFYPSQNVAYFDFAKGRNYLKRFLKIDLKFSDLRDLWLGILPYQRNELKLISMVPVIDKRVYEVKIRKAEDVWKAVVDPRNGDILKLNWSRGGAGAEFEFSEFARCCEVHLTEQELPRIGRNVFFKNSDGSEIELEWSSIEPSSNLDPQLFQIEIPKGVKKLKIQ